LRKLINLLCSTEPSNRALAFQLSHRQEKTYPKFWAFVGSIWAGMGAKPMPIGLSERIEKWNEVIGEIDESKKLHTIPHTLQNLSAFFNLDFYNNKNIKFTDLYFLPHTVKYIRLDKQSLLSDISALEGRNIATMWLNSAVFTKIPVMPLPYHLVLSGCKKFDEDSLLNFYKGNWESGQVCIFLEGTKIIIGNALAKMLDNTISNDIHDVYLNLSGTPLVTKETLYDFCEAIRPDIRQRITFTVGNSKKVDIERVMGFGFKKVMR